MYKFDRITEVAMSLERKRIYCLIQAGLIVWQFDREGENSNLVADGEWGEHSQAVARMFQQVRGLPVTGEPSVQMLMLLFPTMLIRRTLLDEVFGSPAQALLDVVQQQEMPFLAVEVTASMMVMPLDAPDPEDGGQEKSALPDDQRATADVDVEVFPAANDDK